MAKTLDMSKLGIDELNELKKDLDEKTKALDNDELSKIEANLGMVNEWLSQFASLKDLFGPYAHYLIIDKGEVFLASNRESDIDSKSRRLPSDPDFTLLVNIPREDGFVVGLKSNEDSRRFNFSGLLDKKYQDFFTEYSSTDRKIEFIKVALNFIAEKGDMVVDAVTEWAQERSRELMEKRQKEFDKREANVNKFVETDFSKIKQKEETVSDRFLSLTRKYFEGGNNDVLLCASLALNSFNEQEKKEISVFLKESKVLNPEGLEKIMDKMVSDRGQDVSVFNNKKQDDRKHDFPER